MIPRRAVLVGAADMKKFTVFYHVVQASGSHYVNAYHDADAEHGCFIGNVGIISPGAKRGEIAFGSYEQTRLRDGLHLKATPITRCQANRLLRTWPVDFIFPK